jgi:hypothetical protein
MHPITIQALAAQRIGEWRDQAARDRLVDQARRARREATLPAAGRSATTLPEPRSGSWWPARRPAASVVEEPAAVTSESAATEERQPAGGRAA